MLQHCAQEQKEEKQMKIEEFKKITKIEEEFLGVKEEFRELEDSIIIMDQEAGRSNEKTNKRKTNGGLFKRD